MRLLARLTLLASLLALGGCHVLAPEPTVSPTPRVHVPISDASSDAALPSLDGALLLRAYSGLIAADADRTEMTAAQLVVLESGLVVANTSEVYGQPEYRAVQLSVEELEELVAWMEDLSPTDESLTLGPGVGDLDAGTTILQARRADGRTVEILAPALSTAVTSDENLARFSAAAVGLDRLADALLARVVADGLDRDGLAHLVPEVRTAKFIGG